MIFDDAPDAASPAPFLERVATRIRWRNDPIVELRYLPDADALIVDVLPLPPMADRTIADRLCVEFDGDDREGLPTAICLTGLRTRRDTRAAKTAMHLLGANLWNTALALAESGGGTETVRLNPAVRDARVHVWRRLTGCAVGIEIQPHELRLVLAGADGDAVASKRRPLTDHRPHAVVVGIAAAVGELLREQQIMIAEAPIVLGVQIGGPVDSLGGLVHHYNKRGRVGEPGWGWKDVALTDPVAAATGLPTHLLNDVFAYATYERWMHPAPDESLRGVLLIAQGIGAKIIRNGEVDRRRPMEVGNIVLHPGGELCDCGKRGCVEATAGTLAILTRIQRIVGHEVIDMQHAVELAEADGNGLNEEIIQVFREAGHDLADVIGNLQLTDHLTSWAVYGPEPMLTKGSAAGAAFLTNLVDFGDRVAYEPYRACDIRRRPIGGDEGAQGAALAALEHFDLAHPETSAYDAAAP